MSINSSIAQDSQNWNIPYGTYSTLLGGAVIGSAYDLSASYYNPAMLEFHRDPGIVVGAQLYNLTKLRINFEKDSDKGLTKNSITPIPGFIAGRVGSDSSFTKNFTYSLLGRHLYNTQIEHRFNYTENSEERYYELYINQSLREQWGGISFSHRILNNLSFGITGYISYRTQDLRFNYSNTASSSGITAKSIIEKGQLYYYNISTLFKIGIGYKSGALSAGLTVTTPNFKIMGSGDIYSLKSSFGTDSLDLLETDYQESISSHHKTQLAVGFGFGYDFKTFALHTSIEWYNTIKPYKVLDAKSFTGQTSGKQIFPNVIQSANSIINYGAGLILFPNSKNQLYLSYNTDNSFISGSGKSPFLISNWDLRHISVGSILEISKVKFSIGLSYAWGGKDLDDSNKSDDNLSNAESFITRAKSILSYRQISILFGFSFLDK